MSAVSALAAETVSHNQIGQKLGRKGLETRERIIAAMLCLLAQPGGPPVTLTSVAKAASVRLTNLYLYFPDMGELLLAALARVMAEEDLAYLALLRERWPDDGLQPACHAFLEAHFGFWQRHARILHMRNALADANDPRVMDYRYHKSRPFIGLLQGQMDCHDSTCSCTHVATVVLTGLERVATVLTNPHFPEMAPPGPQAGEAEIVGNLIAAEAEVIALAVANRRRMHGRAGA